MQYSSTTTVPTVQCDPPPHNMASFSFKVLPDPDPVVSTGAYTTEADADSDIGSKDNYSTELYNMFEVFTTKKMDPAPSKMSASGIRSLTPAGSTSISVPSAPNACAPQY